MPELAYWISSSSLFLVGTFLLSVAIGLIGIRHMVTGKWIWMLMAGSLVLTALGLWSAAKKEAADARLAGSIDRIAKHYELGGKSAQELADEILSRLPATEWHVSDAERRSLSAAIASYSGAKFPIRIGTLYSNAAAEMFADDISKVFIAYDWEVTVAPDLAIKAGLTGIYIAVSSEINENHEVPPNANVLSRLLTMANLTPRPTKWNIPKDQFILVIGGKPQ